MVNTITRKQSDLLVTLVQERDVRGGEHVVEDLRQKYREGVATSRDASDVITWLLRCPKKPLAVWSPGIYEDAVTSDLYRVYLGQKSGKMLCKRVVVSPSDKGVTYVYAGAASRVLRDARRLERGEIAERTLAFGATHCLICGRRLDDPESVDRGVGPVCWENYT